MVKTYEEQAIRFGWAENRKIVPRNLTQRWQSRNPKDTPLRRLVFKKNFRSNTHCKSNYRWALLVRLVAWVFDFLSIFLSCLYVPETLRSQTHAHIYTYTHTYSHTHARNHKNICSYTYACTHTHTRARALACNHKNIHSYTNAHTHTHTHTHIRTHMPAITKINTITRTHIYTHVYTRPQAQKCTQFHVRTYTYTHTHTHLHILIFTHNQNLLIHFVKKLCLFSVLICPV